MRDGRDGRNPQRSAIAFGFVIGFAAGVAAVLVVFIVIGLFISVTT